ncbi:MAG: ATP phosphoribosyltransferase regulatory subunit [Rhodobacteraceae bacterium]|nr:ATP phosphoribosyltransferase regulatory subunit [Paracoccaceae bacterium]
MPARSDILALAARLRAGFEAAGAVTVETPILQSADTLLDLYGEDIRARAYTATDALRGEQMMRPDFTVPVVQMHMSQGAEPARYTYSGEVFRRQEHDPDRANEYIQVGYEVFDRTDPAAADAEVFALIAQALSGLTLRASTGDMGILKAAILGLSTTQTRKAMLLRHIWRPRRFRALLERYARPQPPAPTRAALFDAADPFADAGPEIGLRSRAEIAHRLHALRDEAVTPPISGHELSSIDALLAVRETAPFALQQLRDIAVDLPAIGPAIDGLDARLTALSGRGVDVEHLDFEAAYGRTSMEYYDGFVFGFSVEGRPDLPPVATGGRYDALTRELGQGAEIPAVGAVLRPGLMLELQEMSR